MADPETHIEVTIDGSEVTARRGEPLLELLRRLDDGAGAPPGVCYHPSLGPIETCDACLVEIDGELRRACALPVEAGLELRRSPRAAAANERALQRLLVDHELYCTVCDVNDGGCELHNAVRDAGVAHQDEPFRAKPYPVDRSNPFYRYDPDQCILCGRCVEACQNLQVNETLTIDWEADRPRVLWDGGAEIGASSCVSCGHCVSVCPCNALLETSMEGEAGLISGWPDPVKRRAIELVKALEPVTGYRPVFALSDAEAELRRHGVERNKTVCTYCGVGCSFEVWTKGREILKIETHAEAPANGISSCVKGKFGWDYVNSPERLTRPLIRDGDTFREAGWDEALELVARRYDEIRAEHGPDAIAVIGSSKCSNEEAYLTQKLARAAIGTNNVDNCSRYCQAPATVGLWRTVGYGGDAGSIEDIAAAELVLIVGSNTAESHPVLATRVKRAQKLRGQTVIVADLREHEMARRADLFVRPNPGTDLVWLSALTRHILEQGLEDRAFLEARVENLDAYRESLEPFTLEYAERVTGIEAATLAEVAERIAKAGSVCGLWAMGVTQHYGGSNTSTAISNLLLVTGNYGRPGTGAYPLRGHNNVQGTSDFGAINTFFPGYQPVDDPEVRARFAEAWGVEPSDRPGLDNHEMIDAVHDGRVRAMHVVGEEIALVDANSHYVEEALETLDFLVVQELFLSRTARFADVILPACPSLEKDGTFTNTERRIQRFHAALEPLGESRPDWRILTDLAERMGHAWGYRHPSEILAECAALTPLFAGVSYDRLEGWASQQWPVAADGSDTPLLYRERFAFPSGKARLYPLEWLEPSDRPDAEYDLHLNNGRLLEHFHEGNMTYKTPGIAAQAPDTFVEVSPQLAGERGLKTGDWVRLSSRRGNVELRVLISDGVRGRELYMPMTSSERPINRLTSSVTDPDSHTPAYKELAVRLEPLGREDRAPLPKTHPRYGRPTPQDGVEVARKWARDDYRFPGEEG